MMSELDRQKAKVLDKLGERKAKLHYSEMPVEFLKGETNLFQDGSISWQAYQNERMRIIKELRDATKQSED
jgi:hypothetical protein